MKKIFSFKLLVLTVTFIFSTLLNTSVFAASPDTDSAVPLNTYIKFNTMDFYSDGGILRCSADLQVVNNYYAVLTVRLQIKDDRWRSVRTWTADDGTNLASISEYYSPTVSGDYRLWAEYKAYDGSGKLVESVTEYSDVVYADAI